jgi:predicted TIM-barrel fold metal-dependent hydrolase
LEREFHDEFDVWAAAFQEDAWAKIEKEMMRLDDPNLNMGVASFGSRYNWESDTRLAHMDLDGIAAELLFPNTVPPFYPRGIISAPAPGTAEEYRLRWAGIKAHNRWMVDFCAQAPGRRKGLAQVFLNNIDDAVAEVRWASKAGLASLLIPADHSMQLVNLYERRLDPFWAACCEGSMPVNRHVLVVAPPETPETGPATDAIGVYECIPFIKRGFSHLILGGVFERFPELKFVFTETLADWVTPELLTLEAMCRTARVEGHAQYVLMNRAVRELSKTPTEYFKRNVWVGDSLMMRMDVESRHQLGVDRIMWGSDYPHHEGSWPDTRLALRWNLWDVPEDEVRRMTSVNAADVYGFDLDFLQTVADKIGPTPEEIATPVSPAELPKVSPCPSIQEAIDVLSRAA